MVLRRPQKYDTVCFQRLIDRLICWRRPVVEGTLRLSGIDKGESLSSEANKLPEMQSILKLALERG